MKVHERGSSMFQLVHMSISSLMMFDPDWISMNLTAWYTGKRLAACLGCASGTSCWSSCTCWTWSSSSRRALLPGDMLMVFLGLDLFGFVVVTPPTMTRNLVCSTGFGSQCMVLMEYLWGSLGLRYRFCSGACRVSHVVAFTGLCGFFLGDRVRWSTCSYFLILDHQIVYVWLWLIMLAIFRLVSHKKGQTGENWQKGTPPTPPPPGGGGSFLRFFCFL